MKELYRNRAANTTYLFLLLVFALSACNLPAPSSPVDDLAAVGTPSFNPGFAANVTLLPGAEQLGTPAILVPPTLTPTGTPLGLTGVVVLEDALCWLGPGDPYDVVSALEEGAMVEIEGVGPQGRYIVVLNPRFSRPCWVQADKLDLSGVDLSPFEIIIYPPTPTPTATATPVCDWSGEWTMSVNGNPYTGTMTQNGNSVTGTFKPSSQNIMEINGTVSGDGCELTGMWGLLGGGDGPFQWKMKGNLKQFIGNGINGTYPWCGWRVGNAAPVPCFWP